MSVKRVKNHGAWVWRARVSYQGKQRARFCDSKQAAEDAVPALRQELKREAEQEQTEAEQPVTLALVCEAYLLDLETRGKGPDTLSTARNIIGRLKEFFGPRMQEPLRLTEADLYAFRAHRLREWAKKGKEGKPVADVRGVKASTINRDFRTVRAMLKRTLPGFCFPVGLFLKEDETRVRWLEPRQEAKVLFGMRAPFRQMARLAALTLMRLSEIRRLRREYVHLDQGMVALPQTKTGPGVVMLNADAQRILKAQLRSHDSEWVFPNPETKSPYSRYYVGKVWRVKARKAGLSDFHFHDLRHHGATLALNAGFSGTIVQELGRWKSERMMRRYAAVTNQTLRAAAEAIGSREKWSGQVERVANVRRMRTRP
jgi:integrase